MGEIAEMMLDGTMCQCCGEFLNEDGDGFPMFCAGCQPGMETEPRKKKKKSNQPKIKCPVCGVSVKKIGLGDHVEHAHYKTEAV